MQRDGGFVCAINRNRDSYQVPLALYEAGLLARFVTDFYAPDRGGNWLPGPLRRRHGGFPSAVTHSALGSFLVQSAGQALKLPMRPVFDIADRMLARTAGRTARKLNAHLYCYAPYLPPEHAIPEGAVRAVFEYHPLAAYTWELLQVDHERFPQTAWSHERERKAFKADRGHASWQRADAVVCASSFTKRSLLHAGCDPAKITVIPYGFDMAAQMPVQAPPGTTCEFLFVGQGIQRKGLHHLIEAWQNAEPANSRLTLVCYRIDPGIREMIRSPSIRLLGRQSRENLNSLYDRADVFVMPSLVEGFGLTYLEALARGCHVVATQNSGIPGLALPAEAATVLDAGDVESLAATLTGLAARGAAGGFDRQAIHAAASVRSWAEFRAEIAAHARSLLPRQP
jgi:glycosyltransferase involved in cell wall biosynthesis